MLFATLCLLLLETTLGAPVNCTALGYTTLGRGYYFKFNTAYTTWSNSRYACMADIPGYSDLAVLKDQINFNITQNWWLTLLAAGQSYYNWVGLYHNDSTYWGSVGWYWVDGTPMSGDTTWQSFRNWSLIGGGWPDYVRNAALWYTGYQPGLVTYVDAAGAATAFCGVPSKFCRVFLGVYSVFEISLDVH
jgi:hypothetical protein